MIGRAARIGSRRGLSTSRRVLQESKPPVAKPQETVVVPVTPKPVVKPVAVPVPAAKSTKKKFSFSGFVFKSILVASVLYGGTLYVATKNDQVYDFVLDKQLPYSEEIMELLEKGTWNDLVKRLDQIKAKFIDDASKIENKGEELFEKTKEKLVNVSANLPSVAGSKNSVPSTPTATHENNSTQVTPAEQLQKPVEVESKQIKHLPLVKLDSQAVDGSVQDAINAFNDLLVSIDVSEAKSSKNSQLIMAINSKVQELATKMSKLTTEFEEEVQTKLKSTQTELLASYTKKELSLTEDLLHQFNTEKKQLEKKLNARLEKEIAAAKSNIEQAAVNAVTLMRIEQTKAFEKLIADKVEGERNSRLANLGAVNSRLEKLEAFAGDLEHQLIQNHRKTNIEKLVSQLKNLLFAPRYAGEKPKLLAPYFEQLEDAVKDSNDEILKLAVADLKSSAINESSLSLLDCSQLLTRWEQLAPELRSASLLPPNAGLLGHLSSLIFSKLLLPTKGARPDGKDIESAIARVQQSLTRGQLDLAVEEAANLKGWTRKLADDWVVEGRKRLEVEFLVNLIETEARLL